MRKRIGGMSGRKWGNISNLLQSVVSNMRVERKRPRTKNGFFR